MDAGAARPENNRTVRRTNRASTQDVPVGICKGSRQLCQCFIAKQFNRTAPYHRPGVWRLHEIRRGLCFTSCVRHRWFERVVRRTFGAVPSNSPLIAITGTYGKRCRTMERNSKPLMFGIRRSEMITSGRERRNSTRAANPECSPHRLLGGCGN
jgi:hypothetical protein